MKHLESSESTRRKSQNDRPSSEIPQESRANLRVPSEFLMLRVAQFVLKIAHLAISMEPRGPCRLRSPTPIMAPDNAQAPVVQTSDSAIRRLNNRSLFVSHSALSNLPPTSLLVLYPQYLGGASPT